MKTMRIIFGLILGLGILLLAIQSLSTSNVDYIKPTNLEIDGNSSNTGTSKEALQLMFDDYTPCNVTFDYKFELDTQGDPITLKFPGVKNLVYYSGKGTIKVPPRHSGPVEILSSNPTHKARVRIWKVISVHN